MGRGGGRRRRDQVGNLISPCARSQWGITTAWPIRKKLPTAAACDTQWRANREERTQRSGINSTAAAAGALRKTPWLAHSHLSDGRWREKGVCYLFYLPTYPRCTLIPPRTLSSFYQHVFPHIRSSSTALCRLAVCPFGCNPRPFSISHCRTSSSPLASHFYFIPFFSLADLPFFRTLHT